MAAAEPFRLPDEPADPRAAVQRWWAGVMRAASLAVRCQTPRRGEEQLLGMLRDSIAEAQGMDPARALAFARIAWNTAKARRDGTQPELTKAEILHLLDVGIGEANPASPHTINLN